MEKNTYVNPFEEVHKRARAAHERLRQVREKDLLIRETQQAAESDDRRGTPVGSPKATHIKSGDITSRE